VAEQAAAERAALVRRVEVDAAELRAVRERHGVGLRCGEADLRESRPCVAIFQDAAEDVRIVDFRALLFGRVDAVEEGLHVLGRAAVAIGRDEQAAHQAGEPFGLVAFDDAEPHASNRRPAM
jgi:hypothetical protein